MEAQVELGLGPLHTVFDDKGYAYTSMFLDSTVARWTLGGPYASKHPEEPWTLVQALPVQYNIGHIAAAEGDTASPDGQYVVALDKWSIDRFANVGPLMPQNFQLVDVSQTGDKMQVLYDMPIGMAEPHYAQIIKADKLKPWQVYPEVGWNPETQSVDPNAVKAGEEKVVRNGKNVEIFMTRDPQPLHARSGRSQQGRSCGVASHQSGAHARCDTRLCDSRLQHQPEPGTG